MGILKIGRECILIKGTDFGKKIKIEKIEDNYIYYKEKDKEKKIGILQVFPL